MKEKYLFVTNPYKISVENNILIFSNKDEEEVAININDIGGIVLDNLMSTITTNALSKLALNNVLVFISNERHIPISCILPTTAHSRTSEKVKYQIKRYMSQDALWKKIIRCKIKNQIHVLNKIGLHEKADKITMYLNELKTIDQYDPIEAFSSREFFGLYPRPYRRFDDTLINKFQNYGYAIIRSTIIQYLNIYGLTPNIGIHHSSGENPNNLADDLIEPYRAFVDYTIYTKLLERVECGTEEKRVLINILDEQIMFGLNKTTIRHSIKLLVEQYNSYLVNNQSISSFQLVSYVYE